MKKLLIILALLLFPAISQAQVYKKVTSLTDLTAVGNEDGDGTVQVWADEGDDAADKWIFKSLAAGGLSFINGSTALLNIATTGDITLTSTVPLGWGSSGVATPDAFLWRDAANTIAMRNGTTSQAFRIYNTDSGNNDEYVETAWETNITRIRTVATGTGTQRGLSIDGSQLFFRVSGTSQWTATTTAFGPAVDNIETFGTTSVRASTGFLYNLDLEPQASAPGSPVSGMIYVDSTASPDELCFYDGAAWQGISSGTDANCS